MARTSILVKFTLIKSSSYYFKRSWSEKGIKSRYVTQVAIIPNVERNQFRFHNLWKYWDLRHLSTLSSFLGFDFTCHLTGTLRRDQSFIKKSVILCVVCCWICFALFKTQSYRKIRTDIEITFLVLKSSKNVPCSLSKSKLFLKVFTTLQPSYTTLMYKNIFALKQIVVAF